MMLYVVHCKGGGVDTIVGPFDTFEDAEGFVEAHFCDETSTYEIDDEYVSMNVYALANPERI